jgi:hypothetical protein
MIALFVEKQWKWIVGAIVVIGIFVWKPVILIWIAGAGAAIWGAIKGIGKDDGAPRYNDVDERAKIDSAKRKNDAEKKLVGTGSARERARRYDAMPRDRSS